MSGEANSTPLATTPAPTDLRSARSYVEEKKIEDLLTEIVGQLCQHSPEDPEAYILSWLSKKQVCCCLLFSPINKWPLQSFPIFLLDFDLFICLFVCGCFS
jgi:hypothetical protein